MRQFFLFALFGALFFPAVLQAQTSTLKGVVTNDENNFVGGATVTLNGTTYAAVAGDSGAFEIANVPYGDYVLLVSAPEHRDFLLEIKVKTAVTDLGFVATQRMLISDNDPRDEPPAVVISDDDIGSSSSQTVSGTLSASRDAFSSAASYVFSAARFRMRGYDGENFETYVNGAPMENLENGRSQFFLWSGLNDVTRNRENTVGLSPATYAFGGIGGSTALDARASKQRKQIQASYALSNRAYENRFMLTWGSGLLKGGWAFAASVSRRWAGEGYVPGTYYDGLGYFAAVEKLFGTEHALGLTVFGSPTERGKLSPAVQEMYDIAGSNYYNPTWGYQNGKVRNASVGKGHLPTAIISHDWKFSSLSNLKTSFALTTGENSNSGIDWFNAPDPRPDFYRKLPSYTDDPATAALVEEQLRNNEALRQIQWDELYLANYNSYESIENANGIEGNTVSGKRSRYILEERVQEGTRIAFSTVYNTSLTDITQLTAGFNYQLQNTDNFKRVKDLMGGEFYVDLNQYAEQDFPDDINAIQNDVNNPNRILYEGDKFGYNYTSNISKAAGWLQGQFKFKRVDLFGSVQMSQTAYQRTGNVKNGLFLESSYGDSENQSFLNYAVKTGLTFKLDGRNFIFGNVSYQTRAPYYENAFVSVRTRNDFTEGLTDEKIFTLEGGYLLKAPRFKIRAVGYLADFRDQVNNVSFYHGDFRTYVNYSLTGIDKRHAGAELAVDVNLGQGFSTYAVAAIGQYFYMSRPKATITADNTAEILAENETIYAQDLRVGGSPQSAYTLGLNYRAKQYWFINLNINYFDQNYVEFNPARRTQAAIDLVPAGSDQWNSILEQEKLDAQLTVDLFGGKSWKLNNYFKNMKRNTFFLINIGVSNILDNTELVSGGFEQLRYDFTDKDPNAFASKYFYSFGRTYFVNLILRMN